MADRGAARRRALRNEPERGLGAVAGASECVVLVVDARPVDLRGVDHRCRDGGEPGNVDGGGVAALNEQVEGLVAVRLDLVPAGRHHDGPARLVVRRHSVGIITHLHHEHASGLIERERDWVNNVRFRRKQLNLQASINLKLRKVRRRCE